MTIAYAVFVGQFKNRDECAAAYARLMREGFTDWTELNEAILARWSMAGLRYVKERAWRLPPPETKPQP